MIKSLLQKLFGSQEKQNAIKNDLKSPSNNLVSESTPLKKGEIQTILLPDFGGQKGLVLKKWHVQLGDIVKSNAIVCVIENKNITFELESFYHGKIIAMCPLHKELETGSEILQIEGI
ncbi:hypothetical protein [uncultured Dokdonia sp.]|uniref:hypothetical protein n=1 Tax=uncultured Dokdonia sp. TaxID=575653 RepID=UPI00262875B5|nr:hypothetical protein [uncultured Dokdonia sp.]